MAGRPLATFLWAFLGVGMMLRRVVLATPIGAAPDEPSHVIQATAIVRGQFDEPNHGSFFGPIATVEVPTWASKMVPPCFLPALLQEHAVGKTNTIPTCNEIIRDSTKITHSSTQFSNAPPLYYVALGFPSLFLAGNGAVYAMRLIGDGSMLLSWHSVLRCSSATTPVAPCSSGCYLPFPPWCSSYSPS